MAGRTKGPNGVGVPLGILCQPQHVLLVCLMGPNRFNMFEKEYREHIVDPLRRPFNAKWFFPLL